MQKLDEPESQDVIIKANQYTTIWRHGYWIFKKTNPEMSNNELWALRAIRNSGYVPYAWRVSKNTLAIWDLGDQKKSWRSITDADRFLSHVVQVLDALKRAGIRHGDLTKLAIIVVDNRPMLIDFAESKHTDDPRPDKRPEGDRYWLPRSMQCIVNISGA